MIVEIVEIVPGPEYKDHVYTQTVVIEFPSGERLRVEDVTKKCSEEYVSTAVEVTLVADIASSVELVSSEDLKMDPVDPEVGTGFECLQTNILDILSKENENWFVALELPEGKLNFRFNKQLVEQLPDEYKPKEGDRLWFEHISNPSFDSIESADR